MRRAENQQTGVQSSGNSPDAYLAGLSIEIPRLEPTCPDMRYRNYQKENDYYLFVNEGTGTYNSTAVGIVEDFRLLKVLENCRGWGGLFN